MSSLKRAPQAVDVLGGEFEALRTTLAEARGARRWQLLERLSAHHRFDDWLRREAGPLATMAAMNRRDFLRYGAAAMAVAGLAGCSRPPEERIVPMRIAPEDLGVGRPQFYATALARDGEALGLLVESHEGRPTKIEGNPQHPSSLGATDAQAQAAVLDVWDPDRSQAVLRDGEIASWGEALTALRDAIADGSDGSGLHVLSGAVTSPTLAAQLARLQLRFPGLRHHVWQAWPRDNLVAGARLAFGEALLPVYRLRDAKIIVALDADPLGREPGHVRLAREFADGRRFDDGATPRMNRLYVAEPTDSLSGSMADHRLALPARDVARLTQALAARFGLTQMPDLPAPERQWAQHAADDLAANRGHALLIAGETQPAVVHALVAAINARLDAIGTFVEYRPLDTAAAPSLDGLRALSAELQAGRVGTLLMIDVNPLYDAPPELGFAAALARAGRSFHLGLYADETAHGSSWHLPLTHALEQWSDACANDGTISIVQPLMAPLYDTRSAHEVLEVWLGRPDARGHDLLREHWRGVLGDDAGFEPRWTEALRRGVIAAAPVPRTPTLQDVDTIRPIASAAAADDIELVFRPDPYLGDGRLANNGWLQELPNPGTQLSWGNVVLLSPVLAREHGIAAGDEVYLRRDGGEVRGPAWISPRQAERSVTVFLGHGRRHAGRIGDGVGFDVAPLRGHESFWFADGLTIGRTGHRVALDPVQREQQMHGREPVRSATLAALIADASVIARPEQDGPFPSLYPERPPGEHAWGMSIDLNACIGCKVCTVACQAENNIPVVGPEQVRLGRVMHWIRVDRYESGEGGGDGSLHQPVPCMHCEHAPCELVCPVGATVHDSDGLNLQVYNRCVGTRFCANNCPYKVRRFNFLQFTDTDTESLKGQRNPDVTVRNRGVMEKCTYCIQRIRAAEIDAREEGRAIRDGEVRTACQSACPTQAITFGDLHDAGSAVRRAKDSDRQYVLLAEHNTRPRTTYSARISNPNPVFDAAAHEKSDA